MFVKIGLKVRERVKGKARYEDMRVVLNEVKECSRLLVGVRGGKAGPWLGLCGIARQVQVEVDLVQPGNDA